ncbi:hypothetical protein ACTHO5_25580 [Cytobacillus praedii]|uniref:hypothetical protein n=1 Tax=Cytobacillus praedii TaxID=1742358 RepID=UPI003F81FC03
MIRKYLAPIVYQTSGLFPTISQHRIAHAHRVSFTSVIKRRGGCLAQKDRVAYFATAAVQHMILRG